MSRPAMVPLLGHGILGDFGLSIVKIKNILMGTCCAYLQDLPSTRTDLAAETLCFSYGRWGMHHSRSCFIGLGQTRVPPKLVGQCQKVWPPGSYMVSLKSGYSTSSMVRTLTSPLNGRILGHPGQTHQNPSTIVIPVPVDEFHQQLTILDDKIPNSRMHHIPIHSPSLRSPYFTISPNISHSVPILDGQKTLRQRS